MREEDTGETTTPKDWIDRQENRGSCHFPEQILTSETITGTSARLRNLTAIYALLEVQCVQY